MKRIILFSILSICVVLSACVGVENDATATGSAGFQPADGATRRPSAEKLSNPADKMSAFPVAIASLPTPSPLSCDITLNRLPDIQKAVACIKNADVSFEGEYAGIMPYLSGASAEVRKIGTDAVPFLYDALNDKNRYIAAHVLLGSALRMAIQGSSTEWNHLKIKLLGTVTDESVPDQRESIKAFWSESIRPNYVAPDFSVTSTTTTVPAK